MSDFTPSASDLIWTANLVCCLVIGGSWGIPENDSVWQKTGLHEMTLILGDWENETNERFRICCSKTDPAITTRIGAK